MNKRARMEFPSHIVMGDGVLEELDEELKDYRKPLFVVGDFTRKFVNGYPYIKGSVKKEYLDSLDVSADIVIGVGGGKNLDAAKYISMKFNIPYALIPTIPSSDGIASPSISLFTEEGRLSLLHKPPLFIILDTTILTSAPKIYKQSGYGDIIAKMSSLYDWKLSHEKTGEYYGYLTSRLVKFAVDHVIPFRKSLDTPEGTNALLESLVLCGGAIGIQRSSRPASGSEHLLSHAIDILRMKEGKPLNPHGVQVGIFSVFTTYLQGQRWKRVRKLLYDSGIDPSLKTLDITPPEFYQAYKMAPNLRNRYTVLNEYDDLSFKEIKAILEEVHLI